MNPNFLGRIGSGCAYGSHLGITGIAAVVGGTSTFDTFANELDTAIGQQSQRLWVSGTPVLPEQGYLLYPTIALVFSRGAQGASHGTMVLNGMNDTFYDTSSPVYNVRITNAVRDRWSNFFLAWRARVTHAFFFGHSYGGCVSECMANLFAPTYSATEISCETYGAPRTMIPARQTSSRLWIATRNVHRTDVVSHIPYHEIEAPLSSRITPTSIRTAFDASGHTVSARAFDFNGIWSPVSNNGMPVDDTTLSMLLWVTYANHLSARQHELATYVSTMTAFALRDRYGTLPAANTTAIPPPVSQLPPAPQTENITGSAPTPQWIETQMQQAEQAAAEAFATDIAPKPARGVIHGGVAGVEYLGAVGVVASRLRAAKGIAKRMNRIRRLLGPLTTDQRSQVLDMVQNSLGIQQ